MSAAPPQARVQSSAGDTVDLEPQDLDAERAMLAAMMSSAEAAARGRSLLEPKVFYREPHQRVFSVLGTLADRGVQPEGVTICAELRDRGDLGLVGGPGAVAEIAATVGVVENMGVYADILTQKARARALYKLAPELRAPSALADPDQTVTLVRDRLAELERLGAGRDGGRFAAAALDGASFAAQAIERPRSLLGDGVLTAGGFAILYGVPGIGKTWHALGLGRALARGEPWLGLGTPPEGVRVGFLELELGAHAVQRRMAALGIGDHERDQNLRLVVRPYLRGAVDLFANPADVDALRAWVRADQLEVLFLDALSRCHSARETAEELGRVIAALDALRFETGCAIFPLHHERKPQNGERADDDLAALRGTSRLQSDPTLLVRLRGVGGLRSVRFAKVSEGRTPKPVYFELGEDGSPRVVDAPEKVGADNRARVLDAVLEAEQPIACSEVAAIVQLSEPTVRAHLGALSQAGKLARIGENKATRYASPTRSPAEPAERDDSAGQLTMYHNGLGDSDAFTR